MTKFLTMMALYLRKTYPVLSCCGIIAVFFSSLCHHNVIQVSPVSVVPPIFPFCMFLPQLLRRMHEYFVHSSHSLWELVSPYDYPFFKFLKQISEAFPKAERILLVQDNLSTHSIASLYKAFDALEARAIAKRFEMHFTPKHGSWLNVAESEISVLSRQCFSRRISGEDMLRSEVEAWTAPRCRQAKKIQWQFTTPDARIKLLSLYPTI